MNPEARREFVRFCVVGALGFLIDASVLYLLLAVTGLGPYASRVVSYVVAATTTWALHRRFTFLNGEKRDSGRQWLRFLLTNAFGGGLNWSVYAIVVHLGGDHPLVPLAGVMTGSGVALAFNFFVSKRFVFVAMKPHLESGTDRES